MAVASKLLFDERIQNISCAQILHKWHPDCSKSAFMFVTDGTKGIFVFFFMMYTAQYVLLRKKLSRQEIQQILKDYLKSVLFGHAFSSFCIVFNCIQYKLLGKFNYYLTTYGTGLFMGLTTLLSPKSRFSIESSYFSMMTLECLLRHLSSENILPRNSLAGAPCFMLCNALMMLLLWKKQNKNKSLNITWFFKPYSKKLKNKICCHEGSCLQDCLKVSTKFFLIGLALSAVRVITKKFKNPQQHMGQLISISHFVDPVYLWSYTLVQKLVHCLLSQARGKDSQEHAFIAGLISGATYFIQPNLSLLVTSTVLITMALFEEAKKNYSIPKLPYEFLSYAISTSILMHFCMTNRKLVPEFFKAMLYRGTNGRSEIVFKAIEELMK